MGGWSSVKAILVLSSFVMVVTFGQQIVILIGGFDMSIASVMTLGGVLTFAWAGRAPVTLVWVIPLVLLISGLVGAVSGLGVTHLRVPPFIMTLATGIVVYGAVLGITGGTPRGVPVPALSALFASRGLGVPYIIYFMIAFAVLASLLQMRTPFGRRLYALGSSAPAAYIAGLSVRRLTIVTYAVSAAASALAGVMMVGYAGGATLSMGDGYLLPSIAAAVVGGTSILGGRGSYPGAVGGAVLLTTLSTIISSLGIAQGWRTVLYGLVILIALLALRDELYVWANRTWASLRPNAAVQQHASPITHERTKQ
ncbi:MAG: ABC transporter permease [Acetobacteraceae bacterium]